MVRPELIWLLLGRNAPNCRPMLHMSVSHMLRCRSGVLHLLVRPGLSMHPGIAASNCSVNAPAEMAIQEQHLGGVVEEVTLDMKLPRERKKK